MQQKDEKRRNQKLNYLVSQKFGSRSVQVASKTPKIEFSTTKTVKPTPTQISEILNRNLSQKTKTTFSANIQTVIDRDFSKIKKTFEDNKQLFDVEEVIEKQISLLKNEESNIGGIEVTTGKIEDFSIVTMQEEPLYTIGNEPINIITS